MLPPRWYSPPGVAKPAHVCIPGEMQCLDNAGPPGAVPGGKCYGAPVEIGEEGWTLHPAGHWFNLTDATPCLMIRLDIHPRLIRWVDAGGAKEGHMWRVPVLLDPVCDEKGIIVTFKTALDRMWNGSDWSIPKEIDDLRRRLLLVNHAIGTNQADLSSAEAVKVALDLLHLGQVFDDHEVINAGWVNEVLVVRTLIAGIGMELLG